MRWLAGKVPAMPEQFRCPHCRGTSYESVSLYREGRPAFPLPLFACCGCSAVFLDPWQFTRCEPQAYQVTTRPEMAPPN